MVLNFGSVNIDYVYAVDHFVRPGETTASTGRAVTLGGKGANQSIALAYAGADVHHAGKIGADGEPYKAMLNDAGVNTGLLCTSPEPTGHAVIQVNSIGENAIILHAGANADITMDEVDRALERFHRNDILLLQNEINDIPHIMEKAALRGLHIFFNAAPYAPAVNDYPLHLVDTLIVNETEAGGITGKREPDDIIAAVAAHYPDTALLLTLGSRGSIYARGAVRAYEPARKVTVADTTAAGDTFIGYFIAALEANLSVTDGLKRATIAAGISVTRKGASVSIPRKQEVDANS